MRNPSIFVAPFLCALFIGCSDTPAPTAKKEAEKVEPVTGQTALYRMYQSARTWAPDAEVLECNSLHIAEVPDPPRESGAAGAWQATFVSPSKNQSRAYTYSVVEASGNLHKGAFAGGTEGYSQHGVTSPFPIAAVKTDTDAAFKEAMTKAADYDKKNPNMKILFVLEKGNKHPDAAWRVVWGDSVQTSSFSVLVDASTGKYLETVH